MKAIAGTQRAWITDSYGLTPSGIQSLINDGEHEYLIQRLSFSNTDMTKQGWVEVGTAKIEVTFHPQDAVIENLADGLRGQISMVRAEAQSKVAQLEEKLGQLLALPNPDKKQEAA